MAVLVPDDIAAWFVDRMNVSAVTASVLGGFWNSRPNEAASVPFGVFTVERQAAVEYTSRGEMPKFTIRAGIVVDQTAATAAQGVEVIVGNAMPVAPTGVTAMIRTGAGTVIQCEPRENTTNVEFPKRGPNDVVACRMAWEVMAQGFTS